MSAANRFKEVQAVLRAQLQVTSWVALVSLVADNRLAMLSVLLGGLTGFVPNLIFALILFRYRGARSAQKIWQSLVLGEVCKFLLTILLFTLAFQWQSLRPGWLFIGFGLALAAQFLTPLLWAVKQNKGQEKGK